MGECHINWLIMELLRKEYLLQKRMGIIPLAFRITLNKHSEGKMLHTHTHTQSLPVYICVVFELLLPPFFVTLFSLELSVSFSY